MYLQPLPVDDFWETSPNHIGWKGPSNENDPSLSQSTWENNPLAIQQEHLHPVISCHFVVPFQALFSKTPSQSFGPQHNSQGWTEVDSYPPAAVAVANIDSPGVKKISNFEIESEKMETELEA